jgi:protein phosphatase
MGTTCDVCFVDFDMLYVAHVGDSRVYLYRDGEILQITTDHTLMQELLKKGDITEKEVLTHPGRHIITRAVGTEEDVKTDFITLPLKDEDVILMCSDGLTNILSDKGIAKVLLPGGNLEATAKKFVEKANEGGGDDNTTVILFKYTSNREEEK